MMMEMAVSLTAQPPLQQQEQHLGRANHCSASCSATTAAATAARAREDEAAVVAWTRVVSANARKGQHAEAFAAFRQMQLEGVRPNRVTLMALSRACARSQQRTAALHRRAAAIADLSADAPLVATLISLYAHLRLPLPAQRLFHALHPSLRTIPTITALISAYDAHQQHHHAQHLLSCLCHAGLRPDAICFITLLHAAATAHNAALGRHVHSLFLHQAQQQRQQQQQQQMMDVHNALITMYGRCGLLPEAEAAFVAVSAAGQVVSWNAMLTAFAHSGHSQRAVTLLRSMLLHGVRPNRISLIAAMPALADVVVAARTAQQQQQQQQPDDDDPDDDADDNASDAYGAYGQEQAAAAVAAASVLSLLDALLHGCCCCCCYCMDCKSCRSSSRILRSSLLSLYARIGRMQAAEQLLGSAPLDAACCTAMLAAYCDRRHYARALHLFRRMACEGLLLSSSSSSSRVSSMVTTLLALFRACAGLADARLTRQACSWAHQAGLLLLPLQPQVGNAALNALLKCRLLLPAEALFSRIKGRPGNQQSWTCMLAAYACSSSSSTLSASDFVARNLSGNLPAGSSSIIDEKTKKNVSGGGASWRRSMLLLHEMQLYGVKPNRVTFVVALDACAEWGTLAHGRHLHTCIRESGLAADPLLLSCLINMYSKLGQLSTAAAIFEGMLAGGASSSSSSEVAAWNTLLLAYTRLGHCSTAFALLRRMDLEGRPRPNRVTFTTLLHACISISNDQQQQQLPQLHARIVGCGYGDNELLCTSLLCLHARSGSLEAAETLFHSLQERGCSAPAWNAMLGAYAREGLTERAVEVFRSMALAGVGAQAITFVALLDAFGHSGSIPEQHAGAAFAGMQVDFGLSPCAQHYTCLLNVLARQGMLAAAHALLQHQATLTTTTMQQQQQQQLHQNNHHHHVGDDAYNNVNISNKNNQDDLLTSCMALLSACNAHADAHRAAAIATTMLRIQPCHGPTYVAAAATAAVAATTFGTSTNT